MSSLFRAACVLSLLGAVASCDLLKKKGAADAGEEEAGAVTETVDAAPAAPVAPLAVNVDDIVRFPDETAMDNAAATLRWSTPREAPLSGKPVATLKSGTAVTRIAQRDKYFLVTFDDPKDATKKLMGWLHQDAFLAAPPVDAGLKALTCTAPDVPLFSDNPFCGRACTKDEECPAGQACKGSAQKFANGKVGENTSVCTVFHPHPTPDAGAPPPPQPKITIDGGLASLVDAGGGKLASIDAGAPAQPAAVKDITDPPCGPDFVMVSVDKKCHRKCPSGIAPKDCKAEGKFCGKCDGQKICSAVRELCK
jgi:hypothetical protein